MTTINASNNVNTGVTYSAKSNNQSEIASLQKQRESLQEELQSLQQELTTSTGDSSDTVQAEIQTLQSQITNIDSQIARLQAESNEEKGSSNGEKTTEPSKELENPETLKSSLSKLDETSKALENSIGIEKARGFNTDNKTEALSNMKKNMESLTSRLQDIESVDEENTNTSTSEETELVGNFVDLKA